MCLQGDIGCPLCWRGTCHTFQLMAWKPRPVDHKAGARNSRRRDECVMANKSVTIFIASRIRKNRPCRCPTRCSKSAERRPCGAKCTSAFQINSSRAQWQCIAHYQTHGNFSPHRGARRLLQLSLTERHGVALLRNMPLEHLITDFDEDRR